MLDFSKNYFELFGMPVGFAVDAGELSARFRELQRIVHPDRYASAGEHSQRLSLQGATLVNEAYQTLKDPLLRAQYLLSLSGVEAGDGQNSLDDPGFLMQQMELRETLAAVSQAEDPHAALERLLRDVADMIRDQVAQLAVQFEESSPEQLQAAARTVQKMQFLNRLYAQAEAVEADLAEEY